MICSKTYTTVIFYIFLYIMNLKQILLTVIVAIISSLASQGYLTVYQVQVIEDIAKKVLVENVSTWSVNTWTATMYESETTWVYIGVE